MKTLPVQKVSAAALLIALGILIPLYSPIRVILEPASFTLASHVAIFVAMLISPAIAVAVAAGTALGFFLGGFPIVIVLRAATHLFFSVVGALYLQRHPDTLHSPVRLRAFSLLLGLVHALFEMAVVMLFYFNGSIGAATYQQGLLRSVFLLVGLGTVIHSAVDFEIAWIVFRALRRQKGFRALSPLCQYAKQNINERITL